MNECYHLKDIKSDIIRKIKTLTCSRIKPYNDRDINFIKKPKMKQGISMKNTYFFFFFLFFILIGILLIKRRY